MFIGVITGIVIAAAALTGYIFLSCQKAEEKKYYDAAYKMVKEKCLDQAISCRNRKQEMGQKVLVYLKWKDQKNRGFVFDPEEGIRIGRNPEENDICIRENSVSGKHCILYLTNGRMAIQDLNSVNGTWIRRGMRKHRIQQAEFLYTGDKVVVGGLKIKIIMFLFDMSSI